MADDLGRSRAVNHAVARAHDEGILTAASIMAGGEAFEEAVEIALARPGLSVGVHLTFCNGRAVLSPERISGLAGAGGRLPQSPSAAGFRLWWYRRSLLSEVEAEMAAQLDRVEAAGLRLSHVDGHHHLHMHPVVFDVVCREVATRGIRWVRIPSEDFGLVLRQNGVGWAAAKTLEWAVFAALAARNRGVAARHGLRTAERVYGLGATGRLDEAYVLRLLPRLPAGTCELFAHPALDGGAGERELEALTSPRVKERLRAEGIDLSGYVEESGSR